MRVEIKKRHAISIFIVAAIVAAGVFISAFDPALPNHPIAQIVTNVGTPVDANNNGKVDIADDSDQLGGVAVDQYCRKTGQNCPAGQGGSGAKLSIGTVLLDNVNTPKNFTTLDSSGNPFTPDVVIMQANVAPPNCIGSISVNTSSTYFNHGLNAWKDYYFRIDTGSGAGTLCAGGKVQVRFVQNGVSFQRDYGPNDVPVDFIAYKN